ncbi:MAG: hypothetical protein GWM98_05965, partial [Nitrospinaceae bacterium]|nr:hypothetical protein [Nitrospinaceae bacterium]NIS84521.1 hypothetical protein [Nitrospinaceae bacterium]NIT81316.1 hypothetical protein [Nitrospinaceae bacterium]NIU95714.1 hypothetical protein [Nitrospinaceae bacterium]NIY14447.1 hypothetical protein [Nitrospinaceae bacterium]
AGAPLQTFAESRDRATPPIPLFPGNGRVRRDVHMDRGFECIDCHSQSDIMGDGNLYSKAYEAVEIRCETCHGTAESYPTVAQITDPKDRVLRLSRHYKGTTPSVGDWMVVSSHNRKLTNVKVEQDKIVVLGKRSGRKYETPLVRHSRQVHSLPGHRQRLGCTACHAQWVPRCTGCHMTLNQSRSPGESGNDTAWNPFRYSMTPVTPALMVGPRGKIVPMLDPPERGVTALDERGQAIAVLSRTGESRGRYREWEYTNPHGYSGSNLAYALNPHSVGKARSCASCHLSPRTLGMGEGDLKLGRKPSGQNDEMRPLNRSDAVQRKSEFGPDAKITARGETLAGTSQPGARPFNQEEAHRILKVGNCIPCHDRYDDPIYRNMDKSYAFEAKVQHRKRRNKILRKR